jgi:hypothetical protein
VIPAHPSRNKDKTVACPEMDAVLTSTSSHDGLLTGPQPARNSQQANDCNRRSPDCQLFLHAHGSCSG